jgi:VWFA-related protein
MFRFEQETAAKFLQDVLKPNDRATIFSIGQKPILVQGRENAERSVQGVMNIAPTKGATAFFDTVAMAANYLRQNSPEGHRKVIVVISDGDDNFSEGVQKAQQQAESKVASNEPDPEYKRLSGLIAQAQQNAKMSERLKVGKSLQDADVVFYSVNPGGSSYKLNQMSVFGQGNMEAFASQTGGTAFLPRFAPIDTQDNLQNTSNARKNQAALDLIFNQLASELRAQYLIQYYPETDYPNGRFVKLSVTLTNPSRGKVRAREGYFVKQ